MDSHPGTHRTYVSYLGCTVLLLEIMCSLKGPVSGEDQKSQYEEQ